MINFREMYHERWMGYSCDVTSSEETSDRTGRQSPRDRGYKATTQMILTGVRMWPLKATVLEHRRSLNVLPHVLT